MRFAYPGYTMDARALKPLFRSYAGTSSASVSFTSSITM